MGSACFIVTVMRRLNFGGIVRLSIALILMMACSAQRSIPKTSLYLGQKIPGLTPEVFAPASVSSASRSEFGSVFSKDGKTMYFGVDVGDRSEIRYITFEHGAWTSPQILLSHPIYGFNDPFLSPDQQSLYFISNRPIDGSGDKKDIDIWFIKKELNGWSEPVNAGPKINSSRQEYYISFTADGAIYFSSNVNATSDNRNDFDIYVSEYANNQFQKATELDRTVNTSEYEADVFVAPDGSYLIFCGIRDSGMGQGDLYISFKDETGAWTEAKNMGAPINDDQHQLCPFVTYDGKYLFYTSHQDIYWVSAAIIEQYR